MSTGKDAYASRDYEYYVELKGLERESQNRDRQLFRRKVASPSHRLRGGEEGLEVGVDFDDAFEGVVQEQVAPRFV